MFLLAWRCPSSWATPSLLLTNAEVPQIDIPFTYQDKFIYVTLSDDVLGTLCFLVDTGAEQTVVTKEIAKKGDIHQSFWRTKYAVNGYGEGAVSQKYETIQLGLRFKEAQIFSASAMVLDLGRLKGEIDHPVDGILGWDFFEQWCATLDYAAKRIALRSPQSCSQPKEAHATLDGEWTTHGLLLPSIVTFANGESAKASLHFDTGSNATLFLNAPFRKVAGLTETGPAATEAKGTGLNGGYTADIVPVSRVLIEGGKLNIDGRNATTILIGRRGSSTTTHWWLVGHDEAKINRDGGIGNGLLEHMSWTFDPLAKRVYVVPNPESVPGPTQP